MTILKILFVCTGDTCRSPMAEAMMKDIILKDKDLRNNEIISAGTGVYLPGPASYGAKEAMASRGINIEDHRSKPVTPEMINNADLILTMATSHKIKVLRMANESELKGKLFTLKEFAGQENHDIQDPFGLSVDEYKKCASEIYDALVIAKEKIKENWGIL